MRRGLSRRWLSSLVWVLLAVVGGWSPAARSAEPLVVGVFLPLNVGNGQERLQLAERLAARLGELLQVPVSGRSFGRFQDFAEALTSGEISVGLVDGWVAGQLPAGVDPVAVAVAGGDRQRIALVAKEAKTIAGLKGSTVAVVRGTPGLEAKAVSHLLFAGDLQAQKHFKLVSVPNAESALEALKTGAAEAAVLSSGGAPGLTVVYPGPPLPAALVVKGKRESPAGIREALLKLSLPPFDRFVSARGDELSDLRVLTQRGPPARVPLLAESAPVRFEVGLVDFGQVELQLPPQSPAVSLPLETPDD